MTIPTPVERRWSGHLMTDYWLNPNPDPARGPEACVLLTTDDPNAAGLMATFAVALGLEHRPALAPMQTSSGEVRRIDADWIGLFTGEGKLLFDWHSNDGWLAVARRTGRVVISFGMAPRPRGMDVDAYADLAGDQLLPALAAVNVD